ncbi:hypothetical protein B0H14DRAFT_2645053 [Mycena olivaceomarginata]|nr:hypothetical protein B0H14DRAFT_2645053 [Mycena olivaceomarginata]
MAAPITAWLSLESCAVTAFDTRQILSEPQQRSAEAKAAVPLAAATRHAVFNGVSDSSVKNFGQTSAERPTGSQLQGRRDILLTLHVARSKIELNGAVETPAAKTARKGDKSRLHFVVMRVDEIDESENVNLFCNSGEKASEMVDCTPSVGTHAKRIQKAYCGAVEGARGRCWD